MNRTFFEDLPARKVGGPVVSSGGDKKPAAKSDASSGGNTEKIAKRFVKMYMALDIVPLRGVDLKAA